MGETRDMFGFFQKQEFRCWHVSSRLQQLVCVACALVMGSAELQAEDTFEPYASSDVPKTAVALWEEYDPRKEPLDIEIVQEWEKDGVITR